MKHVLAADRCCRLQNSKALVRYIPKRAKRDKPRSCLKGKRRELFFLQKRNPKRSKAAKSILEAVKNRGGETLRAIFPNAKTLDQVAYIKTTKKIYIGLLF